MRALVVGLLCAAAGCGQVQSLESQLAALRKVSDEARARDAYRCAPEELASSEAHLVFAEHELRTGDPGRAREHLVLARANALAAARLSAHPSCTGRASATPLRDARSARQGAENSAQPGLRRGSSRHNAAI